MKKSLIITTLLALVLAVFLPPVAMAQQNTAEKYNFSLQEAINYALTHQTAVLNAKIDEEIAINKVKETTGIGLPQISGNFNFQDFLKLPTSLLPGEFFNRPGEQIPVQFGVKYQSTLGIDVNQLVFDGSYLVGLQAAKTYKELSVRSSTRTRIETAVAVTKAYYSVLVNNEQLSLVDANLARLRASLKDTEAFFKNGFVEKIDVDRLKVLTNNLETERENVIRLLALNVDLLKFQMGMPIENMLTLKDDLNTLPTTTEVASLDSTTYRNRVEYSLLETQKKLNELDLKRYRSQYLPSVSAFGSTSKGYQSNSFGDMWNTSFPTSVIGLRIAIPIFDGFQRENKIKTAKLTVDKTVNDLSNLRNAISLEASQSQKMYLNSTKSLDNQRANMELAKEVLRVSKIKYEQGVGSSLEVTTAETSLKEAENNYINALYNQLISKVDLEKALGKITY